jgi:6-phosphogluconolactonase/glucosamine-6-phosphate isomerase/deaminase
MRVCTVDTIEPVVRHLAGAISERLERGQRVLWLISGGSAIAVAVAVQKQLAPSPDLAIGLVDERYGDMGHADSNWTQLLAAGFDPSRNTPLPVLQNKSIEETARDYEVKLKNAMQSSDYRIGLLGIGADGHTSGILPGSPAAGSQRLVDYYEGPDYRRITTTPKCIKQLDEAVVYAAGEAKKPALSMLITSDLPIAEQPAQALKAVQKLIIFTDQIEADVQT